jgi:hypothetical protein
MTRIYDKAGAAFELDHEIDGVSYVRPLIKVFMQSTTYSGDDFHEDEGFEPADFLVARNTSELYDAPPVEIVDAEIKAKREELQALISDAKRQGREAQSAKRKAELELDRAKSQLEKWFTEHSVMMDLGKLLDGQVLYPLSVSENHYHKARDIPRIPKMSGAKYLAIHSGDFEKGQKWVCKSYAADSYGSPFRFFNTEEERAAAIADKFTAALDAFRKSPAFSKDGTTHSTRLDYGTLTRWVETHPALQIPDDIEAMKVEHDADVARQKREQLAAQLAELDDSAA